MPASSRAAGRAGRAGPELRWGYLEFCCWSSRASHYHDSTYGQWEQDGHFRGPTRNDNAGSDHNTHNPGRAKFRIAG